MVRVPDEEEEEDIDSMDVVKMLGSDLMMELREVGTPDRATVVSHI
jgi:hypothetical protein